MLPKRVALTMASQEAKTGTAVKSADRVLDIMELLSDEPQGLTITEISAQLGIARSSAHGLVMTLLQRGYLNPDARNPKAFRLGVRLIQLGLSVADRLDLRSVARPQLEALAAETGETAFMAVVDGADLVYVDRAAGNRDFRTDARLGARRPLHSSSLGKALLAALDDDTVRQIAGELGLRPVTRHTITDVSVLLGDLRETRRRGFSLDRQESAVGICCAGAAVRDHTGRTVAAISLSTLCELFDEESHGAAVRETAMSVSLALGWTRDLRPTVTDREAHPRTESVEEGINVSG